MYDYLLITNVYNIKAIQQMIGKDYTTEGNLSSVWASTMYMYILMYQQRRFLIRLNVKIIFHQVKVSSTNKQLQDWSS